MHPTIAALACRSAAASMNAGEPLLAMAPPVRSPLAQIEYSTTFLASP
jgi:hypothetical protein